MDVQVEYGWLINYAERQFAETAEERKGLDDKAASIITLLSSGAGLTTLGSIVALNASKAEPAIVAWMIPAMLAAYASISFALLARSVRSFWGLPTVAQAKEHAKFYVTEAESKKALVDVWIKVLDRNEPLLARKGVLVNRAMLAFFVSILLLLAPFAAAVLTARP